MGVINGNPPPHHIGTDFQPDHLANIKGCLGEEAESLVRGDLEVVGCRGNGIVMHLIILDQVSQFRESL